MGELERAGLGDGRRVFWLGEMEVLVMRGVLDEDVQDGPVRREALRVVGDAANVPGILGRTKDAVSKRKVPRRGTRGGLSEGARLTLSPSEKIVFLMFELPLLCYVCIDYYYYY